MTRFSRSHNLAESSAHNEDDIEILRLVKDLFKMAKYFHGYLFACQFIN